MVRTFVHLSSLALLTGALFGQSAEPSAKFEAADVHVSATKGFNNAFMRTSPTRNGRYELTGGSIVDFIRVAYGYAPDKILGGPNWVEMDRFDIAAKVPADTTPDAQKDMLQALLEDRFQLKVHKEMRPMPTYALEMGKKPLMKQATGEEDAGCRIDSNPGGPAEGRIALMTGDGNGKATTIVLGAGGMVRYVCKNMTMDAFVSGLHSMMFSNLGNNPILNKSDLKGAWNFDIKWSIGFIGLPGANGEKISMSDAVEKQMGMKLEEIKVPTPVIVIDSVNRKPAANPPGTAEALPPLVPSTEFEVADIKPSDPAGRGGRFQTQPGGRLVSQGMPLRFLIMRAFNSNNNDEVVIPAWANSERFDITAKAPSNGPVLTNGDMDALAPMIRSLLADRFKMTYHTEQRPVSAYRLVAGKPKMKKADPESRTNCKNQNAPPSAPPGSQMIVCQNVTMEQFAERLQNAAQELNWPVVDATGLEGGYDLSLIYNRNANRTFNFAGRGGDAGAAGAVPNAAEPTGSQTIFEAIDKQLGLKLEAQKRNLPVIVIDHLEQKPTEN